MSPHLVRKEPQQGKNRRYGRTTDMEELQQAREEPQQGKNCSKGRSAAREEPQQGKNCSKERTGFLMFSKTSEERKIYTSKCQESPQKIRQLKTSNCCCLLQRTGNHLYDF